MEKTDETLLLSSRDIDEGTQAYVVKTKQSNKTNSKNGFYSKSTHLIPQSNSYIAPSSCHRNPYQKSFLLDSSRQAYGSSTILPLTSTSILQKKVMSKSKLNILGDQFEINGSGFSSEEESGSLDESNGLKSVLNMKFNPSSKTVLEGSNRFYTHRKLFQENGCDLDYSDRNYTNIFPNNPYTTEPFAEEIKINVMHKDLATSPNQTLLKTEAILAKGNRAELNDLEICDLDINSEEEGNTLPLAHVRSTLPSFTREKKSIDQHQSSKTENNEKILMKTAIPQNSASILNTLERTPQNRNLGESVNKASLKLDIQKKEDNKLKDMLIKAIFEHSPALVQDILDQNPQLELNTIDNLGNSLLMLAIKLSYRHMDYFEIIQILLEKGGDPRIRDINGWSCLDEAISQSDAKLISILFDQLTFLKQKLLREQQENLIRILQSMPDFYLEMKWEFESSLVPFISRIAPSDTFKLWKYGKYLRMDNSLISFKNLKTKRRNMSLIFNSNIVMPREYYACASLYSVNRTKRTYTNLTQNIDLEEKKHMMVDLMRANPLQGSFNIKDCHLKEPKSLFGNSLTYKIHEYEAKKIDFRITMEYAVFKKSQAFFKETYETYMERRSIKMDSGQLFDRKDPKAILEYMKQHNASKRSSIADGKKSSPKEGKKSFRETLRSLDTNQAGINAETFENAEVTEKKGSASIFFVQNFPIKLQDLLPAIQFLSKGNDLLQKMESLLAREEVKAVTADNAFPVKLQLPIAFGVKANITLIKYESLKTLDVNEVFFIPKEFSYINRKEAQKTPFRRKKRVLVANILT